jgi:hypothetical protein
MPEQNEPPQQVTNAETTIAAVTLLQAQLKMATDTLDSLDRKASLLPQFLGAVVGGLLIVGAPDVRYSTPQALLIGAGLAVSIGAGFCAIQSLVTRRVAMGPSSTEVAQSVVHALSDFNQATVPALAGAIIQRLEVNRTKAKWFNSALSLTGIGMLLITLARVVGGL